MITRFPRSLSEAAACLRRGDLTSVELTREVFRRADALDPILGVYLARFDERALGAAARADAELAGGLDRGPLHGIPVGVKDLLAAEEGRTTAQSLVLDPGWGLGVDATAVARLRAGGAVITGKFTTSEFGLGLPDPAKPFPIPRNPWQPSRWPGGSSSGSAAGVAAGLCFAALGTDSGGSVRVPAAFCGITGLMPTFGRVPRSGIVPLAASVDRVGSLARSARDCAAVLGIVAGHDGADRGSSERPVPDYLAGLDGSLAGVCIGVERDWHNEADPALEGCFNNALEVLRTLGASCVRVTLPRHEETVAAARVVIAAESWALHRPGLEARPNDYFETTRRALAAGAAIEPGDYAQAQRERRLTQLALSRLFTEVVDLVVTPTATVGALPYGDRFELDLGPLERSPFPLYWASATNPAAAVPIGFTADGLPLSLQLAARPFDEQGLLRAADAYQQATDWHLRIPPLASEHAGPPVRAGS